MNLKIVEQEEAYSILLNPLLVGEKLRQATMKSMRTIISSMEKPKNPLELVILSGGIYYQLQDAFYDVFGQDIPRILLGAKRECRNSGWVADINYRNLEAWIEDPTIMIADTIATGCTIIAVLEHLKSIKDFKRLVISGFAISRKGAEVIEEFCRKEGIKVKFYVGGGLLGLAENGTDMPIIHPESVICEALRKEAIKAYGEDMAGKVCAIWDWGRRNQAFQQHLEEVKEKIGKFGKDPHAEKILSEARTLCE
jgi:hypothetical protein